MSGTLDPHQDAKTAPVRTTRRLREGSAHAFDHIAAVMAALEASTRALGQPAPARGAFGPWRR